MPGAGRRHRIKPSGGGIELGLDVGEDRSPYRHQHTWAAVHDALQGDPYRRFRYGHGRKNDAPTRILYKDILMPI
jgi:hypothetical protein